METPLSDGKARGSRFRSSFAAILLIALACEPNTTQPAEVGGARPLPLVAESPRRGHLDRGQRHLFEIRLVRGELLEVEVAQHGVDLTVRVLGPGGESLLSVDSPYGERGSERAVLATDVAGLYTLELTAAEATSRGSYVLRAAHRPLSDPDETRVAAFRAHAEGDKARQAGDWPAASRAYANALKRWRQAGDRAGESLTLHRLGRMRELQGDPPGALAAYLEAERAARTAGLRIAAADLAFGGGRLRLRTADLGGAVEAFQRAEGLYSGLGDRRRQAIAVNETALAIGRRGDLDAARRTYRRALELARQHADPSWQGVFLTNLGGVYLRLGQSELAFDLLQEALELRRRTGDRRGEGITLTIRGTAERRLGKLREAHNSFLAAWRLLLSEGDRPRMGSALMGLGVTELELGQVDRAERAFTSALELVQESGRRRSEALVLLDLAEVHLARRSAALARCWADKALRLFDELGDHEGQASAYFAIARAERLRGRLEVSHEFLTLALDRVESIRHQARVDPLRTSYLAFRREYYDQAVDVAMELHHTDSTAGWQARALEVSERGRARSLLENLYFARSDLPRRFDPELRDREERAETRLVDLEHERIELKLAGADSGAIDAVVGRRRLAALELAEIRNVLRTSDPASADLLRSEPFDAGRFAAEQLDADTVLLEISLGEDRGYLFVMDPDGVTGYPLPGRDELDPLARIAHASLQESHKPLAGAQATRVMRQLSREVLGPVAHLLGRRRLVVIAESALHYVPFAALPDPRQLEQESPPLLLENHEVVSLPSASVLVSLRRENPSRRHPLKTLAVLADPIFTADDPRLDGEPRAVSSRRQAVEGLERLPFSGEEATAILSLVPEDQHFGVRGFDVDLDLVRGGALADYRILHIATHGRLDAQQPELSGLELSRYDAAGQAKRGTLYAHQIYDLRLSAELVVLSACSTALGREVRGEGLIGLTHGFFHAGTSRVVVSLWSIDDQATTALMTHFYRHLLEGGRTPAAALRAAQRELQAIPRWSAPYFWAGFILQGDWR